MVRFNGSLIHHGNTLTRVCAAFSLWGTTSSHNAIKDYPHYKLAYAFPHMHSHVCVQPCAHTHNHTHT